MGDSQAKPVVYTVTSATSSHSASKQHRERQYLTMMGIRIACFGLMFAVSGWLRLVCILAAVLLPYLAVVLANAHGPGTPGTMTPATPQDHTKRIRPDRTDRTEP